MDGEHLVLAKLCCEFFPEPQKGLVYDLLLHLLCYQFVEFEDRLLRVERGTGMGLIHSSAVADLCFYALVEKGLDLLKWGCPLYVRFRDDIFLVTERPAQMKPLCEELSRRARSCWQLKVDVCSLVGVPMLDVFLFKGDDFSSTGLLRYRPFIKPTARHIPLSHTSIHSWSVHRSWPISEVARMFELSMTKEHFELFRNRKVARFREFNMLGSIVERCMSWTKPEARTARISPVVLLRVVVPFHPGLRHFGHDLRQVVRDWSPLMARVWQYKGDCTDGRFMDIQVSYSYSGPALAAVCRRLSL
jgi:hypothetical protein